MQILVRFANFGWCLIIHCRERESSRVRTKESRASFLFYFWVLKQIYIFFHFVSQLDSKYDFCREELEFTRFGGCFINIVEKKRQFKNNDHDEVRNQSEQEEE